MSGILGRNESKDERSARHTGKKNVGSSRQIAWKIYRYLGVTNKVEGGVLGQLLKSKNVDMRGYSVRKICEENPDMLCVSFEGINGSLMKVCRSRESTVEWSSKDINQTQLSNSYPFSYSDIARSSEEDPERKILASLDNFNVNKMKRDERNADSGTQHTFDNTRSIALQIRDFLNRSKVKEMQGGNIGLYLKNQNINMRGLSLRAVCNIHSDILTCRGSSNFLISVNQTAVTDNECTVPVLDTPSPIISQNIGRNTRDSLSWGPKPPNWCAPFSMGRGRELRDEERDQSNIFAAAELHRPSVFGSNSYPFSYSDIARSSEEDPERKILASLDNFNVNKMKRDERNADSGTRHTFDNTRSIALQIRDFLNRSKVKEMQGGNIGLYLKNQNIGMRGLSLRAVCNMHSDILTCRGSSNFLISVNQTAVTDNAAAPDTVQSSISHSCESSFEIEAYDPPPHTLPECIYEDIYSPSKFSFKDEKERHKKVSNYKRSSDAEAREVCVHDKYHNCNIVTADSLVDAQGIEFCEELDDDTKMKGIMINSSQNRISDNYFEGIRIQRVLVQGHESKCLKECMILGWETCVDDYPEHLSQGALLSYLNMQDPFTMVICGLPGSGKSHTLAAVAEGCLLNIDFPTKYKVCQLKNKMAALSMHFSLDPNSVCEIAGLSRPCKQVKEAYGENKANSFASAKVVVLVSRQCLAQRKLLYGESVLCLPLFFSVRNLSSDQIKTFLGIDDGHYLSPNIDRILQTAKDLLSQCISDDRHFVGISIEDDLCDEIEGCLREHEDLTTFIKRRIELLRDFLSMRHFPDDLSEESGRCTDFSALIEPGTIIVVDLTGDFRINMPSASSIFSVALDQFRKSYLSPTNSNNIGKVVLLDDAEKYLSGESSLCEKLLDTAKSIRHEGVRLVVSSQNPAKIHREFFELSSLVAIHRFHSRSWFGYLKDSITLSNDSFENISNLKVGEAVVFAGGKITNPHISAKVHESSRNTCVLQIRRRLTGNQGQLLDESISSSF